MYLKKYAASETGSAVYARYTKPNRCEAAFHASESPTAMLVRAALTASRAPDCSMRSCTNSLSYSVAQTSGAGIWANEPSIVGTSTIPDDVSSM